MRQGVMKNSHTYPILSHLFIFLLLEQEWELLCINMIELGKG